MTTINKKKWIKIMIGISVIMIILWLLTKVWPILPPFFVAIILSYLLHPWVKYFEKKGIAKTLSIIIVYLILGSIIFLVTTYVMPILIKELNVFADSIPDYTSQIQQLTQEFYSRYQKVAIPESVRAAIDETLLTLELSLVEGIRGMAEKVFYALSHLIILILAPVLAFYILQDAEKINLITINAIPKNWRDDFLFLWGEIDNVLMKFIRGNLLVAFLVGLLTSVGLAIIQLEFAVLLGLIAGLTNLIPYFGAVIGAIPAIIVALLDLPKKVIYVLIVMLLVQQIESSILSPKILGGSLGLHPAIIVFVLLAGGHLFGIIGLLVAVPVAAIAKIIAIYAWRKIMA
jgi:predicted PurR-regulated permease PerM